MTSDPPARVAKRSESRGREGLSPVRPSGLSGSPQLFFGQFLQPRGHTYPLRLRRFLYLLFQLRCDPEHDLCRPALYFCHNKSHNECYDNDSA
jgi:hypothetical protein